ncbi:MAG: LTA synthase family protein [Muribaculaceae bacterium]|nr:LTA synthase family protein [Muribaculaceae bacterium]
MNVMRALARWLAQGRRPFLFAAGVGVTVQLVALLWLLGVYRTPLWGSCHSMGWLHTLLVCSADALLLLLPSLLMRRHWRWVQWPLLALLTAWGVAQLMYFPTYSDLMPLSSFVLWQNLDSLVVDSALGNWARRDWIFVLPFVALAAADVLWLSRSDSDVAPLTGWRNVLRVLVALAVLRVTADVVAYTAFWHKSSTIAEYLNDNYTHVKVSHASYMADNGLAGYLAYCACVEIAQHHDLSDAETERVKQFIFSMPRYSDNTHSAHRDNLVLIVVESLNSWVLDLRIDGREVTPVLNALCADTANIVGRHMRRQVKNGGSSDGHFMYNTGLLPLEQRAVAMVYPDAHYPTLNQALQRPVTMHICGDQPALWNTQVTALTYGYHTFHGAPELQPLLKFSLWQWDKVIFEAATHYLDTISQPFVAQIITLGMHEPYNRTDVPESWISHCGHYTPKLRNYLERTAVFDRELGLFLQRLRQQGLYDNSLIVIVSDHNELVDNEPSGRPSIDPDGRDCLFLVLNSGQGSYIERPFGQIDVYPTLLDLMGANDYDWKGMGYSLMRHPLVTSAATSPVDTYGSGPLLPRQTEAWDISRLMITSRWFDIYPFDQFNNEYDFIEWVLI